jgi:hypothetical protein
MKKRDRIFRGLRNDMRLLFSGNHRYQTYPPKTSRMHIFSIFSYTYLLYYVLAESCPQAPLHGLPDPALANISSRDPELFMLRPFTRGMTNFDIEIVSDPVCLWCYIGKKKLDQAIETYHSSHPEDTCTKTWKPFYVKPHSPEKGEYFHTHILQYFRLISAFLGVPVLPNFRKQYGETMANMMAERVRGIGTDVGIDFKFAGKTGRTREAHRLIQLGKTKSPQM